MFQAYVDHALTLVKPRGSVIVAGALADDLVSDPPNAMTERLPTGGTQSP